MGLAVRRAVLVGAMLALASATSFKDEEEVFDTLGVRAKEHFLKKMDAARRENFIGRLTISERAPAVSELRDYEEGAKAPLWREIVREENDWRSQKSHPTPRPTPPPTPRPTPNWRLMRRRRTVRTHAPSPAPTPEPTVVCKPPYVRGLVVINFGMHERCVLSKAPTPAPTAPPCPPLKNTCNPKTEVAVPTMYHPRAWPDQKCKKLVCHKTPCVPVAQQKEPPCIPYPRRAVLKWKRQRVAGTSTHVRCQVWHCVWPKKKTKRVTHSLRQFTKHAGHAVGPIWPARCTTPAGVVRENKRPAHHTLGKATRRRLRGSANEGLRDDDGMIDKQEYQPAAALTSTTTAKPQRAVQENNAGSPEECATECLQVHGCNSFNWWGAHHFTRKDFKTIDTCELCTEHDYTTAADGQGIDAYTRKRQVHEFVGDDDAATDDDQKDGGRDGPVNSRRRRSAVMASIFRSEEERVESQVRQQCSKGAVKQGPCYEDGGASASLRRISMRAMCMNDDDDAPQQHCAGLCCTYCNELGRGEGTSQEAAQCSHWQLNQQGDCVLYTKMQDGLTKTKDDKAQCFQGSRYADQGLEYYAAHRRQVSGESKLLKSGDMVMTQYGRIKWDPGTKDSALQARVDRAWMSNRRGDCDGHPCGVQCPEKLHAHCSAQDWRGCVDCAHQRGLTNTETCSQPHIEFVCQNLAQAKKAQLLREEKSLRPYAQPALVPARGFHSGFGEMAACVVDKAELLLQLAYDMGTCTRYEQWPGAGCYEKQADVFMQQLRLCCVGHDKLANELAVRTCNKVVRPFLPLFLKKAKPMYDTCANEPAHAHCLGMNRAVQACFKVMQSWRHHRPKSFRTDEERTSNFEVWAGRSLKRKAEEAALNQCKGLFLGSKQPGNNGPRFVTLFRALAAGAETLYGMAGFRDAGGGRFGTEDSEMGDVTGRAIRLMRLCGTGRMQGAGRGVTTTTAAAKQHHRGGGDDDDDDDGDGSSGSGHSGSGGGGNMGNADSPNTGSDALCALRMATQISPDDIDRGNAFDEESDDGTGAATDGGAGRR
eukprot:g431.t1